MGFTGSFAGSGQEELHEAMLYEKLPDKKVRCNLCRRECTILPDKSGVCGVRKNTDGILYSLVYGRTLTLEVDPIEKKPLFHFKPGSLCLGVSTFGCNLFCLHCQNWQTSQVREADAIAGVPFTSPEQIVQAALDGKVEGIAYTYTEPTIFAEYALDTMKLAKKKKLYNVWVSNGYMTQELIDEIAPYLDAINVDFKGDAKFYQDVARGVDIKKIKENIAYLHQNEIHQEITTLVIPGYNDTEKTFRAISEFVYSLDDKIPLHFTRFYPAYKMAHIPPTDISKLNTAREIALETGLKYVYIGNTGAEGSTKCHTCENMLIQRVGYAAESTGLDEKGRCEKCSAETGIIV